MKTEYKWTDGNDKEFRKFYLKTEEFYSSIVGGKGNRTRIQTGNPSDKAADGRSCSFIYKARLCADR